MKQTIKEDIEEKYIRCEFIQDNALLIFTENEWIENRIDIKLRYIENHMIKEQYLTSITKKEFQEEKDQLIEVNLEKNAIAIYKRKEKDYQLDRLYFIEKHTFSIDDFIDIEYEMSFPNQKLSKELVKKRGLNNDKH